MSNFKRILLATPTAKAKDYCLKEWASYVKSLTYPNLDILIVDNSEDPFYYKRIQKLGLNTIHYTPTRGATLRETMTNCSNIIRKKVLDEGYDGLFSLESDIFSAPNIIEHLMSFSKPVVGLSYFLNHSYYSRLIPFELEDFGYNSISHTTPADLAFIQSDGKLKEVYQLGLGCLLIHRSVLEKIPFRWDPTLSVKANADVHFHSDCRKLGIPVYCDRMNYATHINSNWFKEFRKL